MVPTPIEKAKTIDHSVRPSCFISEPHMRREKAKHVRVRRCEVRSAHADVNHPIGAILAAAVVVRDKLAGLHNLPSALDHPNRVVILPTVAVGTAQGGITPTGRRFVRPRLPRYQRRCGCRSCYKGKSGEERAGHCSAP